MILLWVVLFLPIIMANNFKRVSRIVYSSVETQGFLSCNGKPAKNIKIALLSKNVLNRTLTLNQTLTAVNGAFLIRGCANIFQGLKLNIGIAHQCNEPNRYCFHIINFLIPQSYISRNRFPFRRYNFGIIELDKVYGTQHVNCKKSIRKKVFKSSMKL
ncbi:Transthyretin-like family-containing protein [Strongyloides ratti]|uniref:Transthyretin-like family-containing protein n=1 Tax=Strongyloides ratti TaxID=34506 RepID=A0A090N0C3_STRRB|nr:Transthyretin-like family-containing protein [Strongyloides ratti]CEF70437.2 Transthyretin-like family-containing protein [Strongyloides ratti]